MTELKIGSPAPDFSLVNQHGETVSLSYYRGKPVTLVFFPLAFSGICHGELCELRDNLEIFADNSVELLAISVDSKYSLKAWAEQEGYQFSLLSDFWPHGAVAKQYGVFIEDRGIATRATFVIDAEGILRSAQINDPGQARSLEDYKAALAQL